jgi:hypothetical protein
MPKQTATSDDDDDDAGRSSKLAENEPARAGSAS